MSLLVAVPCAVASAVAYGASTAVEHSAAHSSSTSADARGLIALVRNPRWLLGMAGDTLGLLLQVAALATGPVVLVQPILVLALPVSLPIAWALGGPRPGPPEAISCLWLVAGLAAFFALIGDPGSGDALRLGPAVITAVVITVVGVLAVVALNRGVRPVKAAVYAGFGFVAVLMDAVTNAWVDDGVHAFARAEGLVPLVILVVLGGASIALTQAAFQIGALAASFPANLAADPVMAVLLGALLLHEDVPVSAGHLAAYAACLGAIVYGAVRLAADPVPVRPV